MHSSTKEQFLGGLKLGIPIMLGYFPVSFTYGSSATAGGLAPWISTIISATNLTSSGQFAATNLIIAGSTVLEVILVTLIINIRYLLMGLSLTQSLEKNMPLWKKAILAYGITDEIFAVAATRRQPITLSFMLGLILLPYLGWTSGTLVGGIAMNFLPDTLKSALGIALYAMFLSIIIPPSKHNKRILAVVLVSILCSCLLYYLPLFRFLSGGFRMIIVAVFGASFGALITTDESEAALL